MLIFFMKEGWGRKKIFFVNPNDYKAEWYQVHDIFTYSLRVINFSVSWTKMNTSTRCTSTHRKFLGVVTRMKLSRPKVYVSVRINNYF